MLALYPFVRHCSCNHLILNRKMVATLDCHILYIVSGTGTFETNGKVYPLRPGVLIYYPYGIPYQISEDRIGGFMIYKVNFDFSYEFIHIRNGMLPFPIEQFPPDRVLDSIDPSLKPVFGQVIILSNAIWAEHILQSLYAEMLESGEEKMQMQTMLLGTLLLQIHRHALSERIQNPICLRIKKIVEENLHLNNIAISQMLGYHPHYLNMLFRKMEGVTMHQYIHNQRLKRAYLMLVTTDHSISQIAYECGFSSASHLSAAFKKEYDMSPHKLRQL